MKLFQHHCAVNFTVEKKNGAQHFKVTCGVVVTHTLSREEECLLEDILSY